MQLDKARSLVLACYDDAELHRRYAQADKVSSAQTKHDLPHACEVRGLAKKIVRFVDERDSNLLTDEERIVIIPLTAYLHDNGRAESIEDHAKLGAKWAQEYLSKFHLDGDTETLPNEWIARIARTIACHSAGVYRKATFRDLTTDIVVLADKCIGDAERVRPSRAYMISFLTYIGLRKLACKLRKGGEHDVVNYAIKETELIKDGDKLVLKMRIDERVCPPQFIWSVKWNKQAYDCCFVACERLGFGFELEINGTRYKRHDEGDWRA